MATIPIRPRAPIPAPTAVSRPILMMRPTEGVVERNIHADAGGGVKTKYKIGDKVVISGELSTWIGRNCEGRMDHWAGETVTIREVFSNGEISYTIEEDHHENGNIGWSWGEEILLPIEEQTTTPESEDLNIHEVI